MFSRCRIAIALAIIFAAGFCAPAHAAEIKPSVEKKPLSPFDALLKAGRDLFIQKNYAESYNRFTQALTLKPDHRDTKFLAGLAAYWNRKPDTALELWTALLDSAKRTTAEEWQIESHRVMALSALKQFDAAESVVERLRELHRSVAALKNVSGFVREHVHMQGMRAGVWEVIDERREVQELWAWPVTDTTDPKEPLLKKLSIEVAALPGGGSGFIMSEEGAGYRRVYKRWTQAPEYTEVRPLMLQALSGKLKPLEESGQDNLTVFAPAKTETKAPAANPDPAKRADAKSPEPPAKKEREISAAELAVLGKVQAMGLSQTTSQILVVLSRLRELDFDVSKLTRLSLSDQVLAERYLNELNARAPYAQEDAAELVDLISKGKLEDVLAACDNFSKLGARRPYADYVLLTAFNSRGRELPKSVLKDTLTSPDLMVRQTAALLLARSGDAGGLSLLVKEIENADAVDAQVVAGSLQELVGTAITMPPTNNSEAALKEWRGTVASWWQKDGTKLIHDPQAAAGAPCWGLNKK
jgi:hypothetical protein